MRSLVSQADVSKQVAEDLVEEIVNEQTTAVVRETCNDYVQGFVKEGTSGNLMNNLTDDITAESCQSMVGLSV